MAHRPLGLSKSLTQNLSVLTLPLGSQTDTTNGRADTENFETDITMKSSIQNTNLSHGVPSHSRRRRLISLLLVSVIPAMTLVMILMGSWWLEAQAMVVDSPAFLGEMEPALHANMPHFADANGDEPPGDNPPGDDRGGDQRYYSGDIEGEVLRKPDNDQGFGAWLVRSDRGVYYWAYADDSTEFKPTIAAVGNDVDIDGYWVWYIDRWWFVASKIEIKDSGNDEGKIEGILLSAPGNGIGSWIIQTGLTQTIEIIVDDMTRLDDGVPDNGTWVEIRGDWRADNTFDASRVRSDTHEVNEVVVRLNPGVISTTVAARYNLVAVSTLLASANIHRFATDEDEEETIVTILSADDDVIWAELNFTNGIPERHGYKTWRWGGEDPEGYINQGAFGQVNLDAAWSAVQGEGVIIAVLDTGVALEHPAFAGRLLAGYDMVEDDDLPNDDGDGLGWGHGTHIAGIIAKSSPQSKILPVRVLDTNGRGNTFTLAYAIEWAVANGADVINLSLGADANSRVLRDAVERAVERGVIVVAAAGNINTEAPQFPAAYPNVLSVTAVDGENVKAAFAAYGQSWVRLAAPGVGITSTIVGPNGLGYASWSGTSMATGFVSGAAALLRQQQPTTSVAQVVQQFTQTTVNVDPQNPNYVGKLGGLLDAAAVLDMPTQSGATPSVTPTATPSVNPGVTLTITPTPTPSPTLATTPMPTSVTPTVTPTRPITTSLPEDNEPQSRTYLPLVMR